MKIYVLLHFEHENNATVNYKTSHSCSPASRISIQKVDNYCDLIFYVQNVIEPRLSWNKC